MAGKAKTSARSKGYRTQEKKRPFLTKKEIIALVAIVAAIGLGVLLFNLLYSDGSLKLVDGVPQTENLESSLLATQSVNDETHYYKVGEAGQIEGYTRETVEGVIAYAPSYQYMPDDAEAPIDSLTVRAGNRTAAEMATVMLSNYVYNSGIFGEVPNGIQETDLDGRHVLSLIHISEPTRRS